MTTYWITGFEENTVSSQGAGLFDFVSGTVVGSSTYAKTGTYSLKCSGSSAAAYVYKAVSFSPAQIGAVCYVRFVTLPTTGSQNIFTIRTTGSQYLGIGIIYTGGASYFQGVCAAGTAVTGPQISTGQWYKIEFKASASGTAWTTDWWIDGNSQTQATYTAAAGANFDRMYMGMPNAYTHEFYFDNVLVSDYSLIPIGTYDVQYLRPNGDGTHSAGTNIMEDNAGTDIGATTAYDKINSSTPSATTYIRQFATGTSNYAEVTFDDMTSGKTPVGVFGYLCYTSSATQANAAACYIWLNPSEYEIWGNTSTKRDMSDGSTSSLYYKSSGINISLSESNVNSLVARLGKASDASPNPYWIDVWLVVAYTDPPQPTGSLTKTLDNATLSGAGTVDVVGSLSVQLANTVTNPSAGETSRTGIFFAAGAEEQVVSIQGGGLWSGTSGSPTTSTTQKKNGSYSYYCYQAGANQTILNRTFPNTDYIAVSYYIYFVSVPGTYANLCTFPTGGISPTIAMELSGGNPVLYYGFSGKGAKYGTTILQSGQWYLFDIRIYSGSGTQTIDVKVNGVDQGQYTRTDSQAWMYSCNVGFPSAMAHEVYIDDFVLASGDMYPIGDHVCEYLAPISDGTHNAGTNVMEGNDGTDIGATTAYNKINSVPTSVPSSTTYIKQSATGASNYAEVNMADMTTGATPYGLVGFLAYTSSGTLTNTGATYAYLSSTEHEIWGTSSNPKDMSDGSTSDIYYKSAKIPITLSETNINNTTLRLGHSTDVVDVPYWIDAWFVVVRGPVNPTGSLTKTLDSATLSGSATVDVSASASKTLDNATLSGAGTVDISGSLSKTLDNVTLSSTATVSNEQIMLGPAVGIASQAALGQGKLTANYSATGIASASALGTGKLTIAFTATGIASASALGTGKITVTLSGTGIASVAALGTGKLTATGYIATGIASQAALGQGELKQYVALGPAIGIAEQVAYGTGKLTVASTATGIASAAALGVGKITASGYAATGIASVAALGTGKITASGYVATGIASAAALGTGKVSASGYTATGIASVAALGQGKLAYTYVATGIPSAAALGTGKVTATGYVATGIASEAALGQGVLVEMGLTTFPNGGNIASQAALGVGKLTASGYTASGIGSASALGQGKLAYTFVATGIASAAALGAGVLNTTYKATSIVITPQFGTGKLTYAFRATGIPSAAVLGTGKVTAAGYVASGIASVASMGSGVLNTGYTATSIVITPVFGVGKIAYTFVATGIPSAAVFGTGYTYVTMTSGGNIEIIPVFGVGEIMLNSFTGGGNIESIAALGQGWLRGPGYWPPEWVIRDVVTTTNVVSLTETTTNMVMDVATRTHLSMEVDS